MSEYVGTRWCYHCDGYEPHKCRDSGHERDGSGDYWECLTCGWWQTGMSDTHYPPRKYDESREVEDE